MDQKFVDVLDRVMDYLYDRETGEEKIVCVWKSREDSTEMMNLIKGQTEWEQKGISTFETGNGSIITTTSVSPNGMAEVQSGQNYSICFVHSEEDVDVAVLDMIKPLVGTIATVSSGGGHIDAPKVVTAGVEVDFIMDVVTNDGETGADISDTGEDIGRET